MKIDNFKVEIKHLLKEPLYFNIDLSAEELDLQDPEFSFTDRVKGNVTFKLVNDRVIASGVLETMVNTKCVRCLGDAAFKVAGKLDAVYESDKELLDKEIIVTHHEEQVRTYFDGEIIYPQNEFREAIMLELPHLPLCKTDCKGICPYCGVNLNLNSCDCHKKVNEDSNPFKDALKNIKLE